MKSECLRMVFLHHPLHRLVTFTLLCLSVAGAGGFAFADEPSPEMSVKLSRTIPFVAQSTDETCWLACAAMVRQYYGQKVDEKSIDQSVRNITASDRGGQLKATRRECMIALANKGGLQESVVKTLAKPQDTLTNQQLLTTNTQPANTSASPTNKPKVSLFGGTVKFDPVKYGLGKASEYVNPVSKELLVQALKNQEPAVIVCRHGGWTKEEHAMVAVAATYRTTGTGTAAEQVELLSVDVMDPASKTGEIVVEPGEFLKKNLRAIITKSEAEKILQNERDSLTITPAK